ncbi:MAG: RdgB/HAM1 family non-canonical purine NTP pyrophosphatase [Limnobacter sp.]|nr:RdgB/HAM1 family non-canonical purine NTP pyrophosphatase [Limnobacter sp.]
MLQWVLASGNAGKLREFNRLFAPHGIEWVPQGQLGVSEAEEPHCTFLENALAKARHASQVTGLPALADDSGLCVPALQGAPGVLSARYATRFGLEKTDANNNTALLRALEHETRREAFFVCALVWVVHAQDPTPVVAQAFWQGHILRQAQGQGGFGYDPLFWVAEHQHTAASMPSALKNQCSHRAQATAVLLHALAQRLAWPALPGSHTLHTP